MDRGRWEGLSFHANGLAVLKLVDRRLKVRDIFHCTLMTHACRIDQSQKENRVLPEADFLMRLQLRSGVSHHLMEMPHDCAFRPLMGHEVIEIQQRNNAA